jgi:hypothetical protein
VLKICDRIADTVLCMLAIVGGFEMGYIEAKVNEMQLKQRRDFLVGAYLSFTNVLCTRTGKLIYA